MGAGQRQKAFLSIVFVLATVCFTVQVEAARIRVSQESSPGAGDFDAHILGFIESFDECGKTSAQSYAYNVDSYGGKTITTQTNTSHLFFVNTSSGLALFIVHDKPVVSNGGGQAEMRFELSGDPNGAALLGRDDSAANGDVYTGASGANMSTSRHSWVTPNTDESPAQRGGFCALFFV